MAYRYLSALASLCFLLTGSLCFAAPIVVLDGGRYIDQNGSLAVNWSLEDGSTASEYRYAVGTAPADPGDGYVVPWTSCGGATQAVIEPLALANGATYYVYVAGEDAEGNWVHSGQSDGIKAVESLSSPVAAKQRPLDTWVHVTGVASTSISDFADRAYIQDASRASGILIDMNGVAPPPFSQGQVLDVYGVTSEVEGERAISPPVIQVSGEPCAVQPVFVNQRALGGGDDHLAADPEHSGQVGVKAGVGLNNLGLLVRICGTVSHVDPGGRFAYVDDGSALDDGSGHTGVKVIVRGLIAPALYDRVVITGISSCELSLPDKPVRVLRPRIQGDIAVKGAGPQLGLVSDLPIYAATGVRNGSFQVTVPSPVASDLIVTLTSRDSDSPKLGTPVLLAPYNQKIAGAKTIHVVVHAGSTRSDSFDLIGAAGGAAPGQSAAAGSIEVSAPGYRSASLRVNVFQTTPNWNTGNLHWTLAPIQVKVQVGSPSLGWGYRVAQPTTVDLAGVDQNVIGSSSMTIVDNTTYIEGTVPTIGVGVTEVTASAGASIATATYGPVRVTQPTLRTNDLIAGTGVRGNGYTVYTEDVAVAPDDVPIVLTPRDAGVAGLARYNSGDAAAASVNVMIPRGSVGSDEFELIGLASGGNAGDLVGATDILMRAGAAQFAQELRVYQTRFDVSVGANQTTMAPADVYISAGADNVLGWGYRIAQDTAVDVTSSAPSVLGSASVVWADNEALAEAHCATLADGTAFLTASTTTAPILPGTSQEVTVGGPALTFSPSTYTTGTGIRHADYYYGYSVCLPSPAASDVLITVTPADPTVVRVAPAGFGDPPADSVVLRVMPATRHRSSSSSSALRPVALPATSAGRRPLSPQRLASRADLWMRASTRPRSPSLCRRSRPTSRRSTQPTYTFPRTEGPWKARWRRTPRSTLPAAMRAFWARPRSQCPAIPTPRLRIPRLPRSGRARRF